MIMSSSGISNFSSYKPTGFISKPSNFMMKKDITSALTTFTNEPKNTSDK